MSAALVDIVRASRASAGEAVKPLPLQVLEMARLRALRGIGPRYYLTAGLNRRDMRGPAVFGHINADEYRRFIRQVNPPERRAPLNSKIEQKRRLVAAGLPTPPPIYGAEPGEGDPADLAAALAPHVGRRIAVKPASGFGGAGFRSFTVEAADRLVGAGAAMSTVELVSAFGDGG